MKDLVHQKTGAELDGAQEQITLRLLLSNAKRAIAELAAAEGRLLSWASSQVCSTLPRYSPAIAPAADFKSSAA